MNGALYIGLQIAVCIMSAMFFGFGLLTMVRSPEWRGTLTGFASMLVAFIPAVAALWYFA